MPVQAHSTIDTELRKAGLAPDDSARRARMAAAIQHTGKFFGQNEVVRLRAHFAVGFVGLAIDEALEQAILDGSWVGTDDQLRERQRELADEKRRDENDASGIEHVTESNPYGWAKPDGKRNILDHNVPGEWNAFRQAFNLTPELQREHGARDFRVRGCTRWEVLGNEKHPTPHFDAHAVAIAQGKVEPVGAPQREVYGGK